MPPISSPRLSLPRRKITLVGAIVFRNVTRRAQRRLDIVELPYKTRLSSFHFALGAHSYVSYIPSGSSKSFSNGCLSDATLSRSRTSPRRARPYNWISPSAKNSISISLSLLPTTEGFPSPRLHLVSSHVSAPTPADYSAIGEPRRRLSTPAPPRYLAAVLLSISLGSPVS